MKSKLVLTYALAFAPDEVCLLLMWPFKLPLVEYILRQCGHRKLPCPLMYLLCLLSSMWLLIGTATSTSWSEESVGVDVDIESESLKTNICYSISIRWKMELKWKSNEMNIVLTYAFAFALDDVCLLLMWHFKLPLTANFLGQFGHRNLFCPFMRFMLKTMWLFIGSATSTFWSAGSFGFDVEITSELLKTKITNSMRWKMKLKWFSLTHSHLLLTTYVLSRCDASNYLC